jgi:hypothetical protein
MGIGMLVSLSTKTENVGREHPKTSIRKPVNKKEVYIIVILLVASLAVGGYLGATMHQTSLGTEEKYGTGPWLNVSYHYRIPFRVTNTDPNATIPAGYPVPISMEYDTLVSSGRLKTDFSDLRIVYENASTMLEIPRIIVASPDNTTYMTVYFQLLDSISPSQSSVSYYLYYGNQNAGLPLKANFNINPTIDLKPQVTVWSEQSVPEMGQLPFIIAITGLLSIFAVVKFSRRA